MPVTDIRIAMCSPSALFKDTGKSKMLFEIQHCYMDRDTYSSDNFIVKGAIIK